MPDTLTVRRYPPDRVLDAHGVDPLGEYPERFWLPLIGPTTLLLGRALYRATRDHDTVEVDMGELAQRLGTSHRQGPHSPLNRSCARLILFGLAHGDPSDDRPTMLICDLWPTVPMRRARHLAPFLAAELEASR